MKISEAAEKHFNGELSPEKEQELFKWLNMQPGRMEEFHEAVDTERLIRGAMPQESVQGELAESVMKSVVDENQRSSMPPRFRPKA